MRGPGKSYSGVILKLVEIEAASDDPLASLPLAK